MHCWWGRHEMDSKMKTQKKSMLHIAKQIIHIVSVCARQILDSEVSCGLRLLNSEHSLSQSADILALTAIAIGYRPMRLKTIFYTFKHFMHLHRKLEHEICVLIQPIWADGDREPNRFITCTATVEVAVGTARSRYYRRRCEEKKKQRFGSVQVLSMKCVVFNGSRRAACLPG